MTVAWFNSVVLTLQFSPTTDALDTPSYVDISSAVRKVSITRGRSSALDQFSAGTMSVELESSNRLFDPSYSAGTYFGNLLPRKRIRFSAQYSGGTTYPLFTGFVDGWPQYGEMSNTLGTVNLTATDGFKILTRANLPTGDAQQGAGETVTARVGRLLDYAAWPVADRDIDTNSPLMVPLVESGQAIMGELYTAANGDLGQLYIDGTGKVVYRGHSWLLANRVTSTATWGDSAAETNHYSDIVLDYSDKLIFNRAQVGVFDGTAFGANPVQIDVTDTASKDKYGESAKNLGTTGIGNPNVGQNTAEWVIAYYKDPGIRVEGMVVKPRREPTTAFTLLFANDLGTRWTVVRHPQNVGSAISQDVYVEAITHDITPDDWTTSYTLSTAATPSSGSEFWRMNNGKWTTGTPAAVWA